MKDSNKTSKFLCNESNSQKTVSALDIALWNWDMTHFVFECIGFNQSINV